MLVEGGAEALKEHNAKNPKGIPSPLKKDAIIPNLAKIVRLTFHDCINEVSGTGCNGCLNFEGMGNVYSYDSCSHSWNPVNCETIDNGTHPAKGPFGTDNNNLMWVAKVLELVYKDKAHLGASLYDTGKSRADLWAFAGWVGIQQGVKNNNRECVGGKAPCLNQIDELSEPCDFEMPAINFKTGRSDCVPSCTGANDYPFCTSAHENHPSPNGNGEETVKFFKNNFGFNGRETAALMGVHTLGHPMESVSMLRHYPWTAQGEHEFNNLYYVNLVNKTAYRYVRPIKMLEAKGVSINWSKCDLPVSAYIGDEYGNPMPAGYKVRSEYRTSTYGPWSWSLFGKQCSEAICKTLRPNYALNSCCHYVDRCAKVTVPEDCEFKGTKFLCKNKDGTTCTKQDHFLRTSMLSPDIGLYFKFDTDENGRPEGCTGMESKKWLRNRSRFSDVTSCDLNDAPADDELNMAEVMELYARDNKVWVDDFWKVYTKMLVNQVDEDNLVASPTAWEEE